MGLYDDAIEEHATATAVKHGVDPNIVHSMIGAESNGNPSAVSKKGAKGIMQLMDGTAKDMGVKNSMDPFENINGGVKYLASMAKRYGGDMTKAVAAYNAGPGPVDRAKGVPKIKETQGYVQKVMGNKKTSSLYDDAMGSEGDPGDVDAAQETPQVEAPPEVQAPSTPFNEHLMKRALNIGKSLNVEGAPETLTQTLKKAPGRALDVTGEVAGFMGKDVVGTVLQGALESPIGTDAKELAKNAYQSIVPKAGAQGFNQKNFAEGGNLAMKMGSDAYKAISDVWSPFKEKHPDAARHIEAAGNIASILPSNRAVGTATSAVEGAIKSGTQTVAGKAARTLYDSALKGLTTIPFEKSEEITSTLIKHKIPVSSAGLGVDKMYDAIGQINSKSDKLIKEAIDRVQVETGGAYSQPFQVKTQHQIDELEKLKEQYRLLADQGSVDKITARQQVIRESRGESMDIGEAQKTKKAIYSQNKKSYDAAKKGILPQDDPLKVDMAKAEGKGLRRGIEEQVPSISSVNREEGHLWDALPDLNRASNRAGNFNVIPLRTVMGALAGAAVGDAIGGAVGIPFGTIALHLADHPGVKSRLAIQIAKLSKIPVGKVMSELDKTIAAGKPTQEIRKIAGLLPDLRKFNMDMAPGESSVKSKGVEPFISERITPAHLQDHVLMEQSGGIAPDEGFGLQKSHGPDTRPVSPFGSLKEGEAVDLLKGNFGQPKGSTSLPSESVDASILPKGGKSAEESAKAFENAMPVKGIAAEKLHDAVDTFRDAINKLNIPKDRPIAASDIKNVINSLENVDPKLQEYIKTFNKQQWDEAIQWMRGKTGKPAWFDFKREMGRPEEFELHPKPEGPDAPPSATGNYPVAPIVPPKGPAAPASIVPPKVEAPQKPDPLASAPSGIAPKLQDPEVLRNELNQPGNVDTKVSGITPEARVQDPGEAAKIEEQLKNEAHAKMAQASVGKAKKVAAPVKEQLKNEEPKNIIELIKKLGGIDISKEDMAGEVRGLGFKESGNMDMQMLIKTKAKGGMKLDDILTHAKEAGILPEDATRSDLIQAISENRKTSGAMEDLQESLNRKEGDFKSQQKNVVDYIKSNDLQKGDKIFVRYKSLKGKIVDDTLHIREMDSRGNPVELENGLLMKIDPFAKSADHMIGITGHQKAGEKFVLKSDDPKPKKAPSPQAQDMFGAAGDHLSQPLSAKDAGETPLERATKEEQNRVAMSGQQDFEGLKAAVNSKDKK